MPRMPRRPGPLQELPLAHFLPFDESVHANPFKSGSKRLRSPGASVLLSPAKRRLLREERCLPSPDLSRSPCRTRRSDQTLNDTFTPGRRLDFGSARYDNAAPKELQDVHPASFMPRQREVAVPSTSKMQIVFPEMNTYNATQGHASSESKGLPAYHPRECNVLCAAQILIPRELPPSPNRQSADYPGFDVFRDVHIELPSASSRLQLDSGEDDDMELTKENVPPRIRPKKIVSAPDGLEMSGSLTLSPKGKSKLSAPVTPQEFHCQTPATPRAHRTPRSLVYSFTPDRTPRAGRDSLSSRVALEREVDEHCSEDDLSTDDAF